MFVLALSHFYGEFLRNSLAGSKCLSSNEKPQGAAASAPHFSGFAPEDEGQNSTSPEKPGSMKYDIGKGIYKHGADSFT